MVRHLDGLSIERAMHYTCTAPLFGHSHRHDNKFHIAYVFVGRSQIKVEGRVFEIGPADMIFIPAQVNHASIGDEKTFYELVEIHFLAATPRVAAVVPDLPTVVHVNNTATFVPVLKNCVSAHLIDSRPDNWLAKVRLAEMLILIERESQWRVSTTTSLTDIHLKMNQAKEHIALHYNRPISVKDLSELVGISPSHFAATFKQIVGTSPIEFVIQTRLRHARELLASSNFSIGQIAEICGFYSPQYMARLFARRWKLSPKTFRAQRA